MRKNHLSARMSLVALFLVVTALATADSISSAGRAGSGAPQVITVQMTVYAVGRGPDGIAFDGANIWVANRQSDTVTKLRASDGANLGAVSVGDGPARVLYVKGYILVANYGADSISQIAPNTGLVVRTLAVGRSPTDVVYDGSNIWVSNASAGTISKITAP